jgi:hypothetical protein
MSLHFFDTCAIKHRYIGSPHARQVDRVVLDKKIESYIADLTVLEICSALGGACRTQKKGVKEYDAMDHRFLTDIADGTIKVRPTNKLNVIRARSLLRYGGVIKGRNLGSGDALIASCCLDLAHDKKERITFNTADWNLYRILREIDAFTAAMTLQFILPPKHGIPART